MAREKGPDGPNRAVLVVDDDGEICHMYTSLFEAAGLPVRCATTRAEALASNGQPACVVLDWELPDARGWEVAQDLHRRWGPALPIILVTGASLRAEDLAAAAATRWLSKPFDPVEILQAVQDAVDHVQERQRPVSQQSASLMPVS
jgi:CheY-like chemotaxis protein